MGIMPNVGSNNLPGHVLREYPEMPVDDEHIKQDNHQDYLVNGTVWWWEGIDSNILFYFTPSPKPPKYIEYPPLRGLSDHHRYIR